MLRPTIDTLLRGLLAALLLSSLKAAEGLPTQAHQGDLVAWNLTGIADSPTAAAQARPVPYLVIETGTDTGPIQRPAFAQRLPGGALAWHVRHTPRQPGGHAWRVHAADETVLASGTLDVAASAYRGRLDLMSDRRRLQWENGTPFIGIGCNLAWATGEDPAGQMADWFAQLAGNGGNHARIWLATWFAHVVRFDGSIDHDAAALLDEVLAHARAEGITITLCIDNAHDLIHREDDRKLRERVLATLGGDPSAARLQGLRYLLARYGADDTVAIWELYNEIDEPFRAAKIDQETARASAEAWVDAMSAAFHAADVDGRLLTVSTAKDFWPEVQGHRRLSLVQFHRYIPPRERLEDRHADAVGYLAQIRGMADRLGRPFSLAEVGFQGTNEHNDGHQIDPEGVVLRQQAWAGVLLGGYTTGMNWWWDIYIAPHNLWHVYRPIADVLGRLDWTDPDLRPVLAHPAPTLRVIGWSSPRQALLWPQYRGDGWQDRIVEGQDPARFQGEWLLWPGFQPGAEYEQRMIDPVTGAIGEALPVSSGESGKMVLVLEEGEHDRLLLIQPVTDD